MKGIAEFEAVVAAANLPGAVALITDSKQTRYQHVSGMADAVNGVPMREDTLFQVASMTKALTSVAVLQLAERGKVDLDAPVGPLLPELAEPQVLDGFDADGAPILRPAKTQVTLRHLLLHTSGCAYPFMNADLLRHAMAAGKMAGGKRSSIDLPLMFDPGTDWQYGTGIDWAGLAVEAVTGMTLGAWLEQELTGPLGMSKTSFRPAWDAGEAQIHVREADGSFKTQSMVLGGGEFHNGGGGISSTASDYARFLRMILRGGELDGVRVLSPEMARIAREDALPAHLSAGEMTTAMPSLATAFNPLPDQRGGWTLGGFLVNTETGPAGRSPGSLHWAGIFNCYYWIDTDRDLAGVILAQIAPFADPGVLESFAALERMACANA